MRATDSETRRMMMGPAPKKTAAAPAAPEHRYLVRQFGRDVVLRSNDLQECREFVSANSGSWIWDTATNWKA